MTPLDPGLPGRSARPVPGIDNGFLAAYRVRFDEAGADGWLRDAGLLRYAQDIAWRHSEDRGFDRDWYLARGLWWVVRSLRLVVHAGIPLGATLRLTTAVLGHGRIWARRLGEARLADETLAARIETDWVLLDDRGRPQRIPADFGLAFLNPELDAEIIRLATPPDPPDATHLGLTVEARDLDPMGHANNAVYLDWAAAGLVLGGASADLVALPRSWTIEYLASAEPGDPLDAAAWPDEAGWWYRLRRGRDGQELCRVRFDRSAAEG